MRPLRSSAVQAAAAWLLAVYLRLTLRSIRWTWIGREVAEAAWAERGRPGGGVLVCFWHSRITLSPACWPADRAHRPKALISLSADGEFIAKAVEKLGFPAIRGSAGKASDPGKAKGGSAAFRETVRWLRAGHGVAITPDGPRGPAERMGDGPALLARTAGVRTLLVGLACRPGLRLRSWDRGVIPLPFGRGAIVVETAPPDAARWTAALTAATATAEAALA